MCLSVIAISRQIRRPQRPLVALADAGTPGPGGHLHPAVARVKHYSLAGGPPAGSVEATLDIAQPQSSAMNQCFDARRRRLIGAVALARERAGCASLGLDPVGGAFAGCVSNLQSALLATGDPF
jgi:hypothetical protein